MGSRGVDARLTKTLVVLENGSRFKRTTGFMYATSGYYLRHIRPATDDDVKRVTLAHRRRALAGTKWDSIDDDAVTRISDLLDKHKGATKAVPDSRT